jgi:hypothetical protein
LTATDAAVVTPGQPVEIAFVGSSDFPAFTHDIRNGIQMAIEQHPMIRGHTIQLNESDPPSFSGYAAVIGHICSQGFAPALQTYEGACRRSDNQRRNVPSPSEPSPPCLQSDGRGGSELRLLVRARCTVTLDPSTGNRVDDSAALARCAEG